MKKVLFLLLFASITFYSCKVLRPPVKSDAQLEYVNETKNLAIQIYDPALPIEERTYESFSPKYDQLEYRTDSIVSFNTGREYGGNILQQAKYLQKWVKKHREAHRLKGTLSPSDIVTDQEYFVGFIDAVIISEKNLNK